MKVPMIYGVALCLALVSCVECHRDRCDEKYMCKKQNLFSMRTCIDKNKLCDGTSNCPLSDDEKNCTESDTQLKGCGSLPAISYGTYELQYGNGEAGSIGGLKCDKREFGIVDIIRCEADGTWKAVSNITCDGEITDIRLANGSNAREGRVEILFNGVWGTICDDLFEDNSNGATVVCKMLGFETDNATVTNQIWRYGPGAGPVLLDNVQCDGSESSLTECTSVILNTEVNCNNKEDIGVICG